MRGRLPTEDEDRREQVETDLAALGNACVYLDLVQSTVETLSAGQASLLAPALSDIERARRLIKRVQRRISARGW